MNNKSQEAFIFMKPILFNTEMVRAILDGRKTVTRRVVKLKYDNTHIEMFKNKYGRRLIEKQNETTNGMYAVLEKKAPYKVGDILYVRETWYYESHMETLDQTPPDLPSGLASWRYIYKASCPKHPVNVGVGKHGWCPSIHMPKEAARIFLRVTDVRAERLQDMTVQEARREGVKPKFIPNVRGGFCCVWRSDNCMNEPCENRDNKKWLEWVFPFEVAWDKAIKPKDRARYGWNANPWVWVIEFEKISREEAGK